MTHSRRTFRAVVIGLALAAFTQFFALAVTGGGHGWTTPFWFSPALFVLNPVAFVRAAGDRKPGAIDIMLVALAGALDVALFAKTQQEGVEYFWRVSPLNWVWLALWALWQLAVPTKLALIALRRGSSANQEG